MDADKAHPGHVIRLLLTARALRAFADGFVAVLLPAYLLALGYGQLEVGVISTATLLGSAIATLAVGRWGHRYPIRSLILGAAMLMVATGIGFAILTALWPLLIVAFAGTLNPSVSAVSSVDSPSTSRSTKTTRNPGGRPWMVFRKISANSAWV